MMVDESRLDTRLCRSLSDVDGLVSGFGAGEGVRSVVVEGGGGVWGLNREVPHSGASLLKIPLVAALLLAAEKGEVDLGLRCRVEDLGVTVYPSVLVGFEGSVLTVGQLAALSVLTSDNDAAQKVLEVVGEGRVRVWLESVGCESTDVPVGFGDDQFGALRGCMTTGGDQIRVLRAVWGSHVYGPLRTWLRNNVRNTRLSWFAEPPVCWSHKTGSLAGVVHDVGVMSVPGSQVFVAVLVSGVVDSVAVSVEMAGFGDRLVSLFR